MRGAHLADQPLPEGRRLRVRVVDTEDGDATLHPADDDVQAELREAGQDGCDSSEAAPRAREELVPRPEARELAVDVDLERRRSRLTVTVDGLDREPLRDRQRLASEEDRPFRELAGEV